MEEINREIGLTSMIQALGDGNTLPVLEEKKEGLEERSETA